MLIINNMAVNRNTDNERVNSEDQHTRRSIYDGEPVYLLPLYSVFSVGKCVYMYHSWLRLGQWSVINHREN